MKITFVHQRLGRERIKAICQQYNLDEEDQRIVDEILVEWEKHIENTAKKEEIAITKIKNHPKARQIIKAIAQINIEFFLKRTKETIH